MAHSASEGFTTAQIARVAQLLPLFGFYHGTFDGVQVQAAALCRCVGIHVVPDPAAPSPDGHEPAAKLSFEDSRTRAKSARCQEGLADVQKSDPGPRSGREALRCARISAAQRTPARMARRETASVTSRRFYRLDIEARRRNESGRRIGSTRFSG